MIGVFDSGLGGLSVLSEIHKVCPAESTLYFADQQNIPYGSRSEAEVQRFSHQICQYLLGRGATIIVVACNTATAAAIDWLRTHYPETQFVGMEPALKPAVSLTRSGKIGVLATAGTFKSQRYAQLMNRYAQDVQLFQNSCVGLVEQIEAGKIADPETKEMLEAFIDPMLTEGIDTLILGCTHYPFVHPLIKSIVGERVHLIDPAPAVAKQTKYLLEQLPRPIIKKSCLHEYVTSGVLSRFIPAVNRLVPVIGQPTEVGQNRINAIHKTFYQKVDNN
ncbi:MAG: glutamate racemase [Anaerolineae bacterium]